jgi:uncharacterized protein
MASLRTPRHDIAYTLLRGRSLTSYLLSSSRSFACFAAKKFLSPVNYFKIINKYIPDDSLTYQLYLPHVMLVTAKALRIARRFGLSPEQLRFIEEAAMLHDIGIIKTEQFSVVPNVALPYLCHAPIGREILEAEGLPRHALVAERHVGVGLTKDEIIAQQLPLPPRDMVPETLEEKIISWADLFYGKHPDKLWQEHSLEKVANKVKRYGPRQERVFNEWLALFGEDE